MANSLIDRLTTLFNSQAISVSSEETNTDMKLPPNPLLSSHKDPPVILTGDTHGSFARIRDLYYHGQIQRGSIVIVLGDAQINYTGDLRDTLIKLTLSELPITLFCIHGNHEFRPKMEHGYKRRKYHGGTVMVQNEYPNILFALDGEVYTFQGKSCLVIGGAYSVDKEIRLKMGLPWFADEQPSSRIKKKVERVLNDRGWDVDVVLSHTTPFSYMPTEAFLPGLDQSKVDTSTEVWLDEIEKRLEYRKWYCGHYHIKKQVGKMQFLFDDYVRLGES